MRVTGTGSGSGSDCWSARGRELPSAPHRSRAFHILKTVLKEKEMHIIAFDRDKDVRPETLIPMEKIQAPVLMLTSKRDEVWPSFESASYMEQKLTGIGSPTPRKHIA